MNAILALQKMEVESRARTGSGSVCDELPTSAISLMTDLSCIK